jgi:tetratricopeptide (TPR) repeat protein
MPTDIREIMQTATGHHQAGRLIEAEAGYRDVLAHAPGHPDALHMLGVLAIQGGRYGVAVDLLRQAIRLTPQHAPCHNSLGNALKSLGRVDEAIAAYRRAVELRPDFAEAQENLGYALQSREMFREAIACHQRSLTLRPGNAHGHYNLGNLFLVSGEFAQARDSYRHALDLRPDLAEAQLTLGNALHSLGQPDEALACYQRAVELRPDFAEAWNCIGLVHAERYRYEDAMGCLQRALTIQPDYAEGWQTIGTLYEARDMHEKALECFRRSVALKPDFSTAHNNIGNSLLQLGDLQGAMEAYRRALTLDPHFADALSNLGNLLRTMGRLDESLDYSARALQLRPDWPDAQWNRAMTLLLAGDYAAGWKLAESRWGFADPRRVRRSFSQPLWLGNSPLAGRTILLHHEQGLGDTLQMLRYAPLLARQGARVITLVPISLAGIAASVPGVTSVVAEGAALPPFDFHCPFMSLPLALRTVLTTVPDTVPYLFATGETSVAWGQRLGPAGRRRIGLVWSGSVTHKNDRHRSIGARRIQPLLDFDAQFISLQKEYRAEDATLTGERGPIRDFSAELQDFAQTAALIANLDLVISVDTSVAHLAGGMGKPVWVLLPYAPDYRWMLGCANSPWYPTARLFRQPTFGDWDSVIGDVVRALGEQD